jgi:vanillate/4-hydroxybenzoate decarboxylase subunit D
MNQCPRCGKSESRTEYQGKEGGRIIWTVFHCLPCCFTWRDSEPAQVINPERRDPFFNVAPDRIEHYPIVLPPGVS